MPERFSTLRVRGGAPSLRRRLAQPLSVLLAVSVAPLGPAWAVSGSEYVSMNKPGVEVGSDPHGSLPAAVSACTNLPPSSLEVYDIRPGSLEQVVVDGADARSRQINPKTVMRHVQSAVTVGGDFALAMNVEHLVIPSASGGYCDSPSKVRVGIGYATRRATMTRVAAEDPYVRDALLEHGERHARAEDDLLSRFLVDERGWFGRKLGELKQTPAATAEAARKQFAAGSLAVTHAARQHFLEAMSAVDAALDTPNELAFLNSACGGKVGQIEQQIDFPI